MRPEVKQFAEAMSAVMDSKQSEKGDKWVSYNAFEWMQLLTKEIKEFEQSHPLDEKELIDIANFCMIGWLLFPSWRKTGAL